MPAAAPAQAKFTGPAPRPRKAPARKRQQWAPGLTAEVRTYLDQLTLAQLICLAYGHIWPVLIPGRGRPAGWTSIPDHRTQGVFLISESCVRDDTGSTCNTVRTSYTGA